MAKNHPFTNPAFKKTNASTANFNLVPKTTNFNSVFDVQPLDESDSTLIENLMLENVDHEQLSDAQVNKDINSIKTITAEIKAIGRQGILLMGERVSKARDLLKSYQNGTFTKWLIATFGNKKSGYNVLTYFDFYTALPNPNLKEKFRKLPHKAAYMLASRQGDIKKKEEIVKIYDERNRIDLISLIHEKLPIEKDDKRSHKDGCLPKITKLKEEIKQIMRKKSSLSKEGRGVLEEVRDLIDSILHTAQKRTKKSDV